MISEKWQKIGGVSDNIADFLLQALNYLKIL